MKTDPILDLEILKDIAEYLETKNIRDSILLYIGIYTGLRIQDELELRIRDVRDERGKVKDCIIVNEGKTNKPRRIDINKKLKKMLEIYIRGRPGYEYIFLSREGTNKPISRQQAYNILRKAGETFGIRISPHSLRKTFARRLYELSNGDITIPMEALNHTTPEQTRRYIGIMETVINNYIQKLDF
ncbi:phage integrase family [Gottschalkia purinilytica]|uniref:Phage integrase family n=1 Tax=Gottschalkia purinilytica TaxID=1503 RepID=A0A0L0WAR9_GOTPU|nr:tyrosine-type recombinase/integrase [Gottschalkia purinilytica]KNF08542.1 phage integrase family [Gottschalkia purinilytica]